MHQLFQSLAMIPFQLRPLFYAAAGLVLLVFTLGTLSRISIWGQGSDERRLPSAKGPGLWGLLGLSLGKLFSADCLLARRTFARSRLRGFMLIGILWGSLGLGLGLVFSALTLLVPGLLHARQVRVALGFLMDLAGGLLLIGLLMALARRYLFRPARWVSARGDGLTVTLFTLVVVLGFAMEAVRLVRGGAEDLRYWPVGGGFALLLRALGGDEVGSLPGLYLALYLLHAGSAFALLAYIPFSRLFHVFASQITTFTARSERERLEREREGLHFAAQGVDSRE